MSPIVIAILVLQTFLWSASAMTLPCSLRWKSIDAYTPVAKDWVPVNLHPKLDTPSEFLVRVQTTSSDKPGKHLVLSMQPTFNQKKMALVSMPAEMDEFQELEHDGDKIFQSYDILTNPYECKLSWERCQFSGESLGIQRSAYHVKLSPEDGTYVAKMFGENPDATRRRPKGSRVLPVVGNKDSYDRSVRCLKSAKAGIASFSQFEFTLIGNEDQDISTNVLGLDIIDNNSGATVTHTIDHRKRFTETYDFTETHSWEYVVDWELKFEASLKYPSNSSNSTEEPLAALGIEVSLAGDDRKDSYDESTINFFKDKEVVSTRKIQLEPYTSVQACSLTNFENGLSLKYLAKGRHTAPDGTSVEDMRKMLEKLRFEIDRTEGNSVIVDTSGELLGSLATRTSFLVTEFNGNVTCEQLSQKLQQRDRLQSKIRNGDNFATEELEEVNTVISGMKKRLRLQIY
ncbi:unnamed protein product [Allacma fusca]|uniref:Uncharacterized protein n=1 Tax=Allacma fusca TaxID=39272 RepID=A0A8J2NVG0_9HEXA|nr:unnamed protein product [Allacma fusca]